MDTPANERAAFGGVFAAFSSGCARSKMAQDKARYRFDRRVPTKPRNAGLFQLSGKVHIFKKLENLGERRAAQRPYFKRFGGSPIFRRGDDGNKHRKRKTHSCLAQTGAAIPYGRLARNCQLQKQKRVHQQGSMILYGLPCNGRRQFLRLRVCLAKHSGDAGGERKQDLKAHVQMECGD